MILRNHGLLSCGSSVAEAFYFMYMLNRACEMQIAALSGGKQNLLLPTTETMQFTLDEAEKLNSKEGLGQKDFQALIRLLEKTDPTFKT
jgi:ribulose-5-phosphate 4-epimerase/fuculose-1-phosphate aldolase